MTIHKGHPVHYFYLIKNGSVKLFDQKFNYMYELREGGYFGEFNVLFNLYSEYCYKTTKIHKGHHYGHSHDKSEMRGTLLLKIEAETFINIICKDPKLFMNFFRICVKRFKFNKRITEVLNPLPSVIDEIGLDSKYS